jgi:hypothetical protein
MAKAPGVFTSEGFHATIFLALSVALLQAQPSEQQKLAQAAALTRQHRFGEAEMFVKGIPVPPDPAHGIAFHRLRAARIFIYDGPTIIAL